MGRNLDAKQSVQMKILVTVFPGAPSLRFSLITLLPARSFFPRLPLLARFPALARQRLYVFSNIFRLICSTNVIREQSL